MPAVQLQSFNDFAEWRGQARRLLLAVTPPEEIVWHEPGRGGGDLFAAALPTEAQSVTRAVGTVPARFVELGETAICHNDPSRFDLLYRLLWRLQRDRELMGARSDPDVGKLDRRVAGVRRDSHKMTAFVRFRQVPQPGGSSRYLAWFEPEHHVLERTAPFFMRRFAGMLWNIVTPERSAAWDGETLCFGPGGERADVPAEDAMDAAWLAYYAAIFNPARLKVATMKTHMPVKYWRNLPEAALIPSLVRGAREAETEMIERETTAAALRHERMTARHIEEPSVEITTLAAARKAAASCKRCPLYENATQTVFGDGSPHAEIMFIGEQPGDQEDLAGRPFVGPAGQVFDTALGKAGIDRSQTYVTNAVKHFKFEPRGKRRIHKKPNAGEIRACRFWLDLELGFIKPKLVVAMGASALAGLLGRAVPLSSMRGEVAALPDGTPLMVTVHPSYLLRMPDREQAAIERGRFEDDMRAVKLFVETGRPAK